MNYFDDMDGRRQRSANSRRKIVDAMIHLVRSGDTSPSADMVAEAAGVGRRTVFRLFRDMDSIYQEMLVATRERVAPLRAVPLRGETIEAQLHALIDRRARVFEEIMPLVAAASIHRSRSVMLQQNHREVQKELRSVLFAQLPDEFADPLWKEAMDATLSIDLWMRLRLEQNLPPDDAAAILHRITDGLLAQR